MPEINGFASGVVLGTGAAINVSLGWTPAKVEVWNVTDNTIVTIGHLGETGTTIVFTSGGTTEILPGDKLRGATSVNSYFNVRQVLLTSGTWAGGDAAGSFLGAKEDAVGVFGSENVDLYRNGVLLLANAATVVVGVEYSTKIDTATAGVTGNSAITSYLGSSATATYGFTIGSSVSTSGKQLRYYAWRGN